MWVLASLAVVLAEPPQQPTHPVCGGIPGGMYDDVRLVGTTLSVTMLRYISDDADSVHLAAVFYDGDEQVVGRWRGPHAKAMWVEASGAWVQRATAEVPPAAKRVRLYDLHHDRMCEVRLGADREGGVEIVRVARTGDHDNPILPEARESIAYADETLQGSAVDVKRGRKAKLVERDLEEPPDNLEERARMLAGLKQNLTRMKRQQVLDWMRFQGFEADDPDVLETLGANWLAEVPE